VRERLLLVMLQDLIVLMLPL
jgi:hypothetical protein